LYGDFAVSACHCWTSGPAKDDPEPMIVVPVCGIGTADPSFEAVEPAADVEVVVGVADGTSTAPGVGTDGTAGTVVDGTAVVEGAGPYAVLPGSESAQAGADATSGSPIVARTTSLLA